VEIERRERDADDLRRMAREDALTSLPNRRTLENEGARLVELCGHGSVGVMVIDVDLFKLINDRHSHLVGDAVLKRVAELLVASVRPHDLTTRYAGDEFAVVLPGLDHEDADGVRARVVAAVGAEPWHDLSPGLAVSTSIGIAVGLGVEGLWTLFARADADLYAAKRDRP
jgi:diguanylate cyclase (GGDEF)-like protein